jgi:hypothetical protein
MSDPIKITDESGYIVDRAVREAYDRIITHARWSSDTERSAEAFLRLIERYAAKGVHLIPARSRK